MKTIKFSIIIPYTYGGGLREQALKDLFECIRVQKRVFVNKLDIEHVIKFDTILVEELKEHSHFRVPQLVTKHIILKDDRPFNKSWCVNVGIKAAATNNILVVDADVLFDKEYFKRLILFRLKSLEEGRNTLLFNAYSNIVCLPGRDNPKVRIQFTSNIETIGGIWFADRLFFLNVLGGMNENYFGYGAEDNDLWYRIKAILGKIPFMDKVIVHQYHHWAEPAPERLEILKVTRKNPLIIRDRLLGKVGDSNHPTEINIDDLIPKELKLKKEEI